MRMCISIFSAHAHPTLKCACASHFGVHRYISFRAPLNSQTRNKVSQINKVHCTYLTPFVLSWVTFWRATSTSEKSSVLKTPSNHSRQHNRCKISELFKSDLFMSCLGVQWRENIVFLGPFGDFFFDHWHSKQTEMCTPVHIRKRTVCILLKLASYYRLTHVLENHDIFNDCMIAGTVNIFVIGITFKDIAFLKNTQCRF